MIRTNANQVAADLVDLGLAATERVHRTVEVFGAVLQGEVKRRAKVSRTVPRPGPRDGSQGPRLITGDYNRSINRQTTRRATASTAEVGTDAPQALRLELGFVGTDSLGRTFDQQPYPHFGPALDEVGPKFTEAVALAAVPVP